VACDYAVNMILDEERMRPPDNALMSASYRGLTAEEIYPLLHEDPSEETQDTHLFDNSAGESGEGSPEDSEQDGRGDERESEREERNGVGNPERSEGNEGESRQSSESRKPPPPPADPDKLDEQWKSRLAAAAQAARQAGKLSQSLMRFVDNLLAPQLPWRALLARYMMNTARDDYSFQRTSRREGEALMPRLHSQGVKVAVALDSSGSVTREELQEFLTEIDALKAQVRAEVILHVCDDRLDPAGPWKYAMWETLALPEGVSGGGGTDFRPVFEWLRADNVSPDLLVYFTDAEGRFPDREPNFPVLWLVKGKAPVPFGIRLQLN
jgi:hypothetical protein